MTRNLLSIIFFILILPIIFGCGSGSSSEEESPIQGSGSSSEEESPMQGIDNKSRSANILIHSTGSTGDEISDIIVIEDYTFAISANGEKAVIYNPAGSGVEGTIVGGKLKTILVSSHTFELNDDGEIERVYDYRNQLVYLSDSTISTNEDFTRDSTTRIVTDTNQNIMWQDNSAAINTTYLGAMISCNNLDLGGYDDWSLPDIFELYTIVDKERVPTINSIFKVITSDGLYWSSSPKLNELSYKVLDFNTANWSYKDMNNRNGISVRCMRRMNETSSKTIPIYAKGDSTQCQYTAAGYGDCVSDIAISTYTILTGGVDLRALLVPLNERIQSVVSVYENIIERGKELLENFTDISFQTESKEYIETPEPINLNNVIRIANDAKLISEEYNVNGRYPNEIELDILPDTIKIHNFNETIPYTNPNPIITSDECRDHEIDDLQSCWVTAYLEWGGTYKNCENGSFADDYVECQRWDCNDDNLVINETGLCVERDPEIPDPEIPEPEIPDTSQNGYFYPSKSACESQSGTSYSWGECNANPLDVNLDLICKEDNLNAQLPLLEDFIHDVEDCGGIYVALPSRFTTDYTATQIANYTSNKDNSTYRSCILGENRLHGETWVNNGTNNSVITSSWIGSSYPLPSRSTHKFKCVVR